MTSKAKPAAIGTPEGDVSLTVSRIIHAPRERVFDAWVKPELRRQWWINNRGEPLAACEIDARVGGRYHMEEYYDLPDEPEYGPDYLWTLDGEFLEFERPKRLVFTWNVNHKPPVVGHRVAVEFREVPGGTEVTITHTGRMDRKMRDGTDAGWTELLANIDRLLGRA
jgi:glutathione S-transferase